MVKLLFASNDDVDKCIGDVFYILPIFLQCLINVCVCVVLGELDEKNYPCPDNDCCFVKQTMNH